MSFESVSTEIIKDSINSAIYVDDNILMPFEENDRDKPWDSPTNLYSSFRKNNCSLDFLRFDGSPIKEAQESIFYNRDLLIMDWHLDPANEDNLLPSLQLLEQASLNRNLHFCVIYTSEEKGVLAQKVISNIASYFSGLTKSICKNASDKFKETLDATGLGQDEITETSSRFIEILSQLSFEKTGSKESKDLMSILKVEATKIFGGIPQCKVFIDSLNLSGNSLTEKLIQLGFALTSNQVPDEPLLLDLSISRDKLTVRIKNLFIKVFSKKEVSNDELYDELKKSLINESNIFLTLLGLEMRTKFRESSAFISRELDGINHLAFFYHKQSHFDGHDDLFHEFLKDMWKDQVASFLMENEISLFSVLDEYKTTYKITEALASFKHDDNESQNSLARLNFVYNRLAIKRRVNDVIRFGDVFYFEVDGLKSFLLCLTPHCDCLRPGKIRNMFFFVEGKELSIPNAIKKGDGDYISYIKSKDQKILCVDWTMEADDCKPFTLYLPDHKIKTDNMSIEANVLGQNRTLVYLSTLKENYAQRIANKAFFYPLRVGIDFASFPKK